VQVQVHLKHQVLQVRLERQVLVEVKTKAETFWQLLVELVGRRVQVETWGRVVTRLREAIGQLSQP
jgi:hypothetical protein